MLIYKGGEGQWSWIFHRVTGIGVFLFLFAHIIDTMLVGWGPEVYDKVVAIYSNPIFKISEVGLFASLLYHALNGIRIIIVDFWSQGTKYHKQMFWIEIAIFVVAMVPISFMMLRHL